MKPIILPCITVRVIDINSAKGTGTPAVGMGFGGNKESGTGEILNSADPLQAFTRPGRFSRIAQNKDVPMSE